MRLHSISDPLNQIIHFSQTETFVQGQRHYKI